MGNLSAAYYEYLRSDEWKKMFRKYITDGGRLCLAGRNAEENDLLINMNWHPNTIILHTEKKGSPFVVII